MSSDNELLRVYAEANSQEAFAELVRRHSNLVYSAALRQTHNDAHLAQDVAQLVFADLARKARKLAGHPCLTGWLYTSTFFSARKLTRTEQRRRIREQEAQSMQQLLKSIPEDEWERIEPVLDQAMHQLKEDERSVILMRYFENQQFSEIGTQIGLSEDGARKRVDRALNKLRLALSKHATASTAALGLALSANAVHQVPPGLVPWLTTTALAGASTTTGTVTVLWKLIAMNKIQTATITAFVLASVLTPLIVSLRAENQLRSQDELLKQQSNQMLAVITENTHLKRQLQEAKRAVPKDSREFNEVLRLRDHATQLRRAADEMAAPGSVVPLSAEDKLVKLREKASLQVAQLKEWLADHPSEETPELRLASDSAWINAVNTLDEDNDFARALSKLRFNQEAGCLAALSEAWRKYAEEHKVPVPNSLKDLRPYLDAPIGDEVIQRYVIVSGRHLASPLGDIGEWVLTQAAPVNPALDWRMGFSQSGLNNILGEGVTNRWDLLP
jgi:RNA polymerase sigma factor (sigma-70 family)